MVAVAAEAHVAWCCAAAAAAVLKDFAIDAAKGVMVYHVAAEALVLRHSAAAAAAAALAHLCLQSVEHLDACALPAAGLAMHKWLGAPVPARCEAS